MAKQLSVLLLEDVNELGRVGEIVNVSEGHARNFLFPEGKAALASAKVRSRAEQQAEVQLRKDKVHLQLLQNQAEKLEGSELLFEARVRDGLDIYGSIGKADIVDRLNRDAKLNLKPKDISLPAALKKIGSVDITVKLSLQIECSIRVTVTPAPELGSRNKENE